MTERTLHLPVAAQPSVESLVDLARLGERHGYERAWLPETWGRDAVTVLTSIARETDEIGIGSSILPIYSRSPALLGQTAATLQEVSDGRLRLGLGPSGPAVIEGWHGVDFDRPLRRTRETVEIVRAVLSGETVSYDGECFSLAGFRLRCGPPETPVPIDVAGMGPKSVELAGRFADGWHATVFTPDGLEDRLEDLARGVDLGGRDLEDVRVTLSVTACALADGERARELARQHLAFYVGAMGTYYRESLARQGYEPEANEIAAAWASGEPETATDLITDDLLDDLGAAGTPDRAREELATFESIDGVDRVAIGFPRGAETDEIGATLEALAPDAD
ncbi:TIGR04024 family LLM class F420-dependent oxidoreductase [Halobacteria archaeon AArc-m2/3/4]|uniref:TIGR04024 family LLM class F420-dependent oxidoreductase n=1 Tax=Natronoglomus mannanivorans TaxID=2979990 RepID=A0AAP2YX29_9EURY|nr:TIGR04024 family LLM class F420-dependent oxidoreductase [Halobacteria archaeon AArc-xg1-1]MCU4971360.1 TIGR04024 family LLM class F420-dependent oxidoreductase [Halobacteria archaeon AArc-m2/3/4]